MMEEVNTTMARVLVGAIADWQKIKRGWQEFDGTCVSDAGHEQARNGILKATGEIIRLKDELVNLLFGGGEG